VRCRLDILARAGRGWRRLLAPGVCALLASPALAAEEGTPYVGDLGQAIATLVIFGLLLALLTRYAWKPVLTQVRRREEGVSLQLEDAARQQRQAKELLALYRSKLDAAEEEARKILADSRDQASDAYDQAVAAAHEEAQRVTREVHEELDRARRDLQAELDERTAELAAQVAAQVLREGLSDEQHDRLLADSLQEIRQHVERERV